MKMILMFLLTSELAHASKYDCSVKYHKENPTAMTGALICGEFKFDSSDKNSQTQKFDKCENLIVDYKTNITPEGTEYFIELSLEQTAKKKPQEFQGKASLVTKVLPAQFRVERTNTHQVKKHVLTDVHILDCQQNKEAK